MRVIPLYNGQGRVELLDVIPSRIPEGFATKDAVIAADAAMSTGKTFSNNTEIYDFITKLFSWKHFSPFEQATLKFGVTAPMVVFWQLDRHRTFQYASHLRRSGRYTEYTSSEFYYPTYLERDLDGEHALNYLLQNQVSSGMEYYKLLLDKGVKKEAARFVLPAWCMIYSEVMTVNLKNLMHFLALRMAKAAQIEIRELANAMFTITEAEFPYTMKVFKESGVQPIDYDLGEL